MIKRSNISIRKVLLKANSQIQSFIFRQSCSVSSIPWIKIISKEGNILTFEVEQCSLRLIDFLKVMQNQCTTLSFLDKTLSTCDFLSEKFGHFALASSFLKLDSQERLKVWISEDPTATQPQLPIISGRSGQKVMIKSILAIFKPYLNCYQVLIKRDNIPQLQQVIQQLMLEKRYKNDIKEIKKAISTTCLNQLSVYISQASQEQIFSAGTIQKSNYIGENQRIKNTFYRNQPSVRLSESYKEMAGLEQMKSTQNLLEKRNMKKQMFRNNSHYFVPKNSCTQPNNLSVQGNQINLPSTNLRIGKAKRNCITKNEQKFVKLLKKNSKVVIDLKQEDATLNSIEQKQNFLQTSKIYYESELLKNLLNQMESPNSKISLKSRTTNCTLEDQLNELFAQQQFTEDSLDQLKKEFELIL